MIWQSGLFGSGATEPLVFGVHVTVKGPVPPVGQTLIVPSLPPTVVIGVEVGVNASGSGAVIMTGLPI